MATSSDSFLDNWEQERQNFWRARSTWSEEQRCAAWAQQTADLVGRLRGAGATGRSHEGLGGTSSGLARSLDQGRADVGFYGSSSAPQHGNNSARSTRSSFSAASPSSSMPTSTFDKRSHQQTGATHSLLTAPAFTNWTGPGNSFHPPQPEVTVYKPADYISKLNNSSDHSYTVAQRQRVNAFDHSNALRPQCTPSYSASLDTSYSSSLSPSSSLMTPDTKMSRQSSATSASLADGFDMLRVESSLSSCSEHIPFPFDEMDASMLSCATLQPGNSGSSAGYRGDASASQWLSGIGSGMADDRVFPCNDFSFSFDMMDGQIDQGRQDYYNYSSEHMQRSTSERSTSNNSSAGTRNHQRRRKQIVNSRRSIASKSIPSGPLSHFSATTDSKVRALRPQEPGTVRKEPISKASYVRPAHAKLLCSWCLEHPEGFRGAHELQRHHERAHSDRRRVWICVDPSNTTKEGWRPSVPIGICKYCNEQKQYNVYYNAAAHLRRTHFNPRKRGRKARGEERESRAGKAGGDWPPIDWLKKNGWLKEIEVGPAEFDENTMDRQPVSTEPSFAGATEMESHLQGTFTGLEAYQDDFTNDPFALCYSSTDFVNGYPTPTFDSSLPQWGITNHAPYQDLQAPIMQHTTSAPCVLDGATTYSSMFV